MAPKKKPPPSSNSNQMNRATNSQAPPLQTPVDEALLFDLQSGLYEPKIPRDPQQYVGHHTQFGAPVFISQPGQIMEPQPQPLPSIIIPYEFPGVPIPSVPQNYAQWSVDAQGVKKSVGDLLHERLTRGHGPLLSQEFANFVEADPGKKELLWAERGNKSNYPYANLDSKVQESDFLVGANIYSTPFSDLENAVLGVEATAYLQHMLDDAPTNEPLLAALGGDPIALKSHIEKDLDQWKEHKMRPLFVFDGQSVHGKEDMALNHARVALLKTQNAWDMYSKNQPEDAVRAFGASSAVRAQDLYRLLQDVLHERKMEFIIAPFSACAQLAYFDKLETQYIDGIMGSKELLLFDIYDSMFNCPTAADWEKKNFTGIMRSDLALKLNVTPEMLNDALLMVGTTFLSPFPPLQVESIISSQPYTLTDAINLLRTSDKSVTNTCVSFHDILEKRDKHWLENYRKAKMAVQHCITVDERGSIHVRDYDNLTSDNHEYLGLQLPAELYHYLSKALIGPRIMNYFVHRELIVLPTLDGVISDEYKKLVSRDLVPLKETTAALISSRIHRAIQHYEIVMRFWFDDGLKQTLVHRNLQPQTNQRVDTWGMKNDDLQAIAKSLKLAPGTISFAVASLQDVTNRTKTFRKPDEVLEGKAEIASCVLWRLLHLRGYINDNHELTVFGKALAAVLKSIRPTVKAYKDVHHIEEAAFLALELIRFEVLNSRNRHNDLIGGALRGSEEDKASCILIGRTACLLKLRHASIGYTGPLSKNFLSFHSIVKAVRETDRDLLEAALASMLLNAQAVRPVNDCDRLGRSLPFCTDVDTSLGIAVKTYLDDFYKVEWSPEEREDNKKQYVDKYLPHSINFPEDLDIAFKFFDAVCDGVKMMGDEVNQTDRSAWEKAKAYLDLRR